MTSRLATVVALAPQLADRAFAKIMANLCSTVIFMILAPNSGQFGQARPR